MTTSRITTVLALLMVYLSSSLAFTTNRSTSKAFVSLTRTKRTSLNVGKVVEDLSSPETSYPWDKQAPKTSLSTDGLNQAHTATPLMLNFVEAGHWITMMIPLVTAYSIVDNLEFWTPLLNHNSLQATLWILAPLVHSSAAVIPPVVQHMYEDWQVVPVAENALIEHHNNARLHKVFLSLMFALVTLGDAMYFFGYYGANNVAGVLPLAAVAAACFWDKNDTVDKYMPSLNFPEVSVGSWSGQAVGFILKAAVYYELGSHASPTLLVALLLGHAMEAAGGIYEGVVTESTFRQWDHLVAAILFILGNTLQAGAFWMLPHYLSL